MYYTVEHFDRACGFLLINEDNTFIYCCKKCPNEFSSGSDLETHILYEHQNKVHFDDDYSFNEQKDIENVFVNDYNFAAATAQTSVPPPNAVSSISDQEDKFKIGDELKNDAEFPWNRVMANQKDTQIIESTVKEEPISWPPESENTSESSASVPLAVCSNESLPNIKSIGKDSTGASRSNTKKKRQRRSSKVPKKTTRTNVFYCDMCPYITLSTLEILRRHMKRHILNKVRKPCTICKITPRDYEKHMKMTHLEAKPYKCDFCGSSFRTNNIRLIHMRTHTSERPFLCAICGMSFKSLETANKHNLRMHTDKLPHPCSECERSFINPSTLQEHFYSFHSDVRPYSCDICGKQFKTKKYVRKHKQSHGEKIHSCRYCEKKFKATETRRWHERTVHKVV